MLRWRAIGYVSDIVFPDVIGGMYRPEELGAVVDMNGDPLVVEGEVMQTPPPPPITTDEAVKVPTFADLLKEYTPEQVIDANGGVMPQSDEDLINVERVLQNGVVDY